MAREWKKLEDYKATLPLTQGDLRMMKSRFPNLRIVGTPWVLTLKEPDFKARLVVQGCQEDPSRCKTTKSLLGAIVKEFDMSRKQDDFVFCGRRVRVTPEALLVSQEFAASSLAPMELCGPQRSAETVLTYSEHREYRSLLGKLQCLQLQSRPDQSYEVNRAAQRSSAPMIADARALNAISLKAQRSSETILRYPRGVIDVSTVQLVTYGDASFANMEGSKSQCGVIVFLTHEPRRFWHGEFQLGHLVCWTSSTIKRVVRSTFAAEAYSVSEGVEEAQWLRSVLAEMWPSVPCSLPRSLRTEEMDSLRRPIVKIPSTFAKLSNPTRELDRISGSKS